MLVPTQTSSSGANAARIIVATVPLGAIFVMLAGSSTSRPHESVNMTVSAAGSSAGVDAGALPQAARESTIASARRRTSAFFMVFSSFI